MYESVSPGENQNSLVVRMTLNLFLRIIRSFSCVPFVEKSEVLYLVLCMKVYLLHRITRAFVHVCEIELIADYQKGLLTREVYFRKVQFIINVLIPNKCICDLYKLLKL